MDASFNPNAVEAQTNQGDDLGGIGSAFLDAASQQSDNTGLGVTGQSVQSSTPIQSVPVTQTQAPAMNSGGSSPQPQAIVPPIVSPAQTVNEALQSARTLGLQLPDNASDAQIAQALVQHLRTVQPFVQYGQAYLPHAEKIQQALSPAPPQAPQGPAEPEWNEQEFFQKSWGAPEWRPEFDTAISRGLVVQDDETGAYVAKPGCEMLVGSILGPLNDASGFNQQKWREIAKSNPIEFFYKNMLEPMRRQWQQDLQQTMQQERSTIETQSAVAKFEQDNSSWMYANGQPTQEGQWFLDTVSRYQGKFGGDLMAAIEVANEIRSARVQSQQPNQAAPQQVAQQPQPISQPQAVAAPQAPQQTSFIEDARQRASHTPRAGGTTVQSPSYQPENISALDLDNLFSASYAATKV